jgi:hypothetical protein
MREIKLLVALLALASSINVMAAKETVVSGTQTSPSSPSSPQTFPTYNETAPVSVSSGTAVSDAPSAATGTNTNTVVNNNWANADSFTATPFDQNSLTTTTTSSSNNPLLSTEPQFNVADVKVTASGGCEVKKNGAVIMTGGFAGSPCQKIYGKGLGQSTSSSALPTEYLPANLDVSFDAQTLDARAY